MSALAQPSLGSAHAGRTRWRRLGAEARPRPGAARRSGHPALLAALVLLWPLRASGDDASPPVSAEAASVRLRTTLKGAVLLARAREVTPLTPERVTVLSAWRLRLEPVAEPAPWLTLSAALESRARLASSAAALASPGLGAPPASERGPWRAVTLEQTWASTGGLLFGGEVDRLAVALHLPRAEVTVGRQAVGFGRGLVFGAVDLFAPFSPLEVDREWRRGVDAARVELRLGPRVAVEALTVLGRDVPASAALGRVRADLGPLDLEVLGGVRAQDLVGGVAASGPVGGAEWHAELAALWLHEPLVTGGAFGEPHLAPRAVAGASYQLGLWQGVHLFVEGQWNQLGLTLPVDARTLAADATLQARLRRGDLQGLGRAQLAVGATATLDLARSLALQVLVDPLDGSGVVLPSLRWDLAEATSVLASAWVGFGAPPTGTTWNSALGATPLTVLVQLRVDDLQELRSAAAR